MKNFGFCPKCHNMKPLERHHVYPKRFFGRKGNRCVLLLCAICHRKIEKILPRFVQLHKSEYKTITGQWLLGKNPIVRRLE